MGNGHYAELSGQLHASAALFSGTSPRYALDSRLCCILNEHNCRTAEYHWLMILNSHLLESEKEIYEMGN
jgi:hypothetical protein